MRRFRRSDGDATGNGRSGIVFCGMVRCVRGNIGHLHDQGAFVMARASWRRLRRNSDAVRGFCWQNPLPGGESLIAVHGSVRAMSGAWGCGRDSALERNLLGATAKSFRKHVARSLGKWSKRLLVFVGESGTLVHFDGKLFRSVSGYTQHFYAVFGTAADDVFVAGEQRDHSAL